MEILPISKISLIFDIGKGGYIVAVNIAVLNNKTTIRLNHNSYVYDKNGKRILHFNNQKKETILRYEIPINVPGKLKKSLLRILSTM